MFILTYVPLKQKIFRSITAIGLVVALNTIGSLGAFGEEKTVAPPTGARNQSLLTTGVPTKGLGPAKCRPPDQR